MAWFIVQGYPVPDSGNRPDNTLPGPQPTPGWPAYPGGPGGGLPGGPGPVDPGYSPPWARPQPPVDPGYSPPWAQVPGGGRPPLGIWGPNDPRPTPPIYIPIVLPPDPEHPNLPTHPIYIPVYPDNALPGDQPRPDNTLPGPQPTPGWPAYPGGPGGGLPGNPDQPRPPVDLVKLKKIVSFLLGNLPTNPDPVPTPVA